MTSKRASEITPFPTSTYLPAAPAGVPKDVNSAEVGVLHLPVGYTKAHGSPLPEAPSGVEALKFQYKFVILLVIVFPPNPNCTRSRILSN